MELHVMENSVSLLDFTTSSHPWSIALDGYVKGPPSFDGVGHYLNFNHHDGVSRLETRSTAAQVLMAIRMGLFKSGPWQHVWVNDCDEDVCLAWWMLKHHYLCEHQNPAINRLSAIADVLDATGGSYPLPVDMPILGQVAWIFDPYRRARYSGKLTPDVCTAVIQDVEQRIMRYVVGAGESLPIEGSYVLEEPPLVSPFNLSLVREVGPYARNKMLVDGIQAFVAHQPLKRATTYTIGKLNPYINFSLEKVWVALNNIEPTNKTWGGGDMIGGSPRPMGSELSPVDVFDIVCRTTA